MDDSNFSQHNQPDPPKIHDGMNGGHPHVIVMRLCIRRIWLDNLPPLPSGEDHHVTACQPSGETFPPVLAAPTKSWPVRSPESSIRQSCA